MAKLQDKTLRIVNTVITTLEVIVIVFLLFFSLLSISTNSGGSFFGLQSYAVESNSMKGTFDKGDLIFIKPAKTIEQKSSYKVGDVITFHMYNNEKGVLNTHRIVEIISTNGNVDAYVTAGDNNKNEETGEVQIDTLPVEIRYVVGKYTGGKLKVFGNLISFSKKGNNFVFMVIIPLVALFIWNGYYFIRLLLKNSQDKAYEEAMKNSEEQKKALLEEAKRQLLEEMRAKEENNSKND